MPIVKFTSALRPFFPNLKTETVEATSIMEVLEAVNQIYPGIIHYVLEEDQSQRM